MQQNQTNVPGPIAKILASVGVLFAIFVTIGLLGVCMGDDKEPIREVEHIDGAETPPKAKEPTAEDVAKNLMDMFMAEEDVEKAINFAKGDMVDSVNEMSAGTAMFGVWASKRLRWADVYRDKNETSMGKIKKDSSTEIGKRMCTKGKILSISRDHTTDAPVFTGLIMTGQMDVVNYIAVGDTGELVEDSRVKFCGVVTGNHSYNNAGGGTTHAVSVVGMFDLPGNRQTAPEPL